MMALGNHFADDLPLYALDALEGDERAAVEDHLRQCPECRSEVEQLREEWSLIGSSASASAAPPSCRERLISAVAREPRQLQTRVRTRPVWLNRLPWVIAAAAALILVWLARENNQLQGQIKTLQARSTAEDQQLRQARELVTALTSAKAEQFTLVTTNTTPQPQGKAVFDPGTGTLVFLASHMPSIPLHRAYELWLLPNTGPPIPAGLFRPDAQGAAILIKPPLPARIDAKTFAITVEPETGSSAPTSQPIMVGTRG